MKSLIGHTGFVGKNLSKKSEYNLYNSSNLNDFPNIEHETVFIAAPGAEKWKINLDGESDIRNIKGIVEILNKSKFKKVVLFSSIDVYEDTNGLNEDFDTKEHSQNYGRNRIYFENEIKKFDNYLIIRLPGLFGEGLKKNVIYDILFNNVSSAINMNDVYQWYNVENLYDDVQSVIHHENKIFNFFPEPIKNSEIINLFPKSLDQNLITFGTSNRTYNLKTKYTDSGYYCSKLVVLEQLKKFIEKCNSESLT